MVSRNEVVVSLEELNEVRELVAQKEEPTLKIKEILEKCSPPFKATIVTSEFSDGIVKFTDDPKEARLYLRGTVDVFQIDPTLIVFFRIRDGDNTIEKKVPITKVIKITK